MTTYKGGSKIAWRNPRRLPGGSESEAGTQGGKAGNRWGIAGPPRGRAWVRGGHSRTSTKSRGPGALGIRGEVTEGGWR